MTAEKQRIAIAEACGKKCVHCGNTGIMRKFGERDYAKIRNSHPEWIECWPAQEPDVQCSHLGSIPDYLHDLNAIHEAVRNLIFSKRQHFFAELPYVMGRRRGFGGPVHITECILAEAADMAETFLRITRKWEDS